jgi:hypothetical protein
MLSQVRDLDLQLLRLFVCVLECGGFSAAQGELSGGQINPPRAARAK